VRAKGISLLPERGKKKDILLASQQIFTWGRGKKRRVYLNLPHEEWCH